MEKSYKDYVEHHGIKGQRWGVRRTPEQLGHVRKSTIGYKPLKYESHAMREIKEHIKSVPEFVAIMLVPGFSIAYSANFIKKWSDKSFDGTNYLKKDGKVEKVSQLKKKNKQTDLKDDIKKINSHLPGGSKGRVNNCVYCSFAMEMRRRGYDVKARRKGAGIATDDEFINRYFKETKREPLDFKKSLGESKKSQAIRAYNDLCTKLESQGAGASGLLDFDWLRSKHSGHMIYYNVDKTGEVTFYDGQTGEINNRTTFSMADPKSYCYTRLDKATVTDDIGEVVISVKDPLFRKGASK